MISRQEALRIGTRAVRAAGLGSGARCALLLEEITASRPKIYGAPDLSDCWIVYAERPTRGPQSSDVVLISRTTGAILYTGTANDEG